MHRNLRLIQRHASLIFVLAGVPILLLILNGSFTEPALPAVWAVAQGVAVVWIGSAAWDGRERWAVRVQATFIGVMVAALIASQQAAAVSGAGLLVFLVAVLLIHFAHILGQTLYSIQKQLVSVRGFARTEAARQALFFLTFAVPAALSLSPTAISLAVAVLAAFLVADVTARRAVHLLQAGLAREASDA